jgi:hypothetical protein
MPIGVDLLHALADTPNLSGALCARVENKGVFDACVERGRAASYERAKTICRCCPVFTECRRWVASLPFSKRTLGVCGGPVHSAGKSDAA